MGSCFGGLSGGGRCSVAGSVGADSGRGCGAVAGFLGLVSVGLGLSCYVFSVRSGLSGGGGVEGSFEGVYGIEGVIGGVEGVDAVFSGDVGFGLGKVPRLMLSSGTSYQVTDGLFNRSPVRVYRSRRRRSSAKSTTAAPLSAACPSGGAVARSLSIAAVTMRAPSRSPASTAARAPSSNVARSTARGARATGAPGEACGPGAIPGRYKVGPRIGPSTLDPAPRWRPLVGAFLQRLRLVTAWGE
jgi:hypothetical protein